MKTKINITLDESLLETIDKLATSENRNRSNMIESIIRKSIGENKMNDQAKLVYDGKVIGTITTNHSMSIEDAASLLNIDLNEMDGDEPVWDIELFKLEY